MRLTGENGRPGNRWQGTGTGNKTRPKYLKKQKKAEKRKQTVRKQ